MTHRTPSRRATGAPRAREGRLVPILIVLLFVIMLVAGALPRLAQTRQRESERTASSALSTVFTDVVTRDTAPTAIELPGSVAGLHETGIFARTNGFVKSLRVDLGSSVRAGDTLIVLDLPDITEQSRQARATLEQVEATAQLARATLARWRSLAEREAVTKQELDERQAASAVAEAAVRAARANVANLSEVLRFGAILAPFSGVVTSRAVDIGALVSAGAATGNRALLTLVQTDTLRVLINVPQSAATNVRIGQKATMTVQELGNAQFEGRVALTARAFDATSRTLLTEVQVPNTDRRLMPGMFSRVRLSVPASGAGLRIPAIALIIRADGPQVAVVENGTVRLVPIKLGRDFGTVLEVLDGVTVGAQIIVNPSEQLMTGSKVRAIARGTPATDAPKP
ncbi:MAG: efflux RND transporter periplasmic adaptor subunit [Gemmatimonadaceae bacterium]|jgi:RND family efflux transporter MFP subunit|nr:efflux RND transporter periplasmic adaptor subunit [Gemmatimonadaceae bacterium]MCC6431929.1 efflux RND transporter periplasmic adaptor subunit [Gemmatimonadaceae bacterium]